MSTTIEVTQKDLHDLLEIFERKPFDAGSCEEGSLVSYLFLFLLQKAAIIKTTNTMNSDRSDWSLHIAFWQFLNILLFVCAVLPSLYIYSHCKK